MQKYIIWKTDGVLFTSQASSYAQEGNIQSIVTHQIQAAYQAIMKNHPDLQTPTDKEIEAECENGMPIPKLFQKWSGDLAETLYKEYVKQEEQRTLQSLKALPNAKEAIDALSEAGVINLAIGFRAPHMSQQILQREGFKNVMILPKEPMTDSAELSKNLYVIPTETQRLRPSDPEIWEELIKKAFPKIKEDQTLIFGKESAELKVARRLGIPCAWGTFSGADINRCNETNPDFWIYDMKNAARIIAKHFDINLTENKIPEPFSALSPR